MDQRSARTRLPLAVDLDGTLIAADLFWESFIRAFKANPLVFFLLPLWLLKGKAYAKEQLAARADIDPAKLPYREDFIEFLKSEKASGRVLVLATVRTARSPRQLPRILACSTMSWPRKTAST